MQSSRSNRLARIGAIATLGALAALACRAAEPGSDARGRPSQARAEQAWPGADQIVLATVDGEAITLEDAMSSFLSTHTGHGVLVRTPGTVREIVGRLVERHLLLTEADSLGIPDEPALVAAVEEYRLGLAEIAYWKRMVDEQVSIPEEEVEAFYDKTDVLLQLSLVECAQREQAQACHERLAAGEDLAALAAEVSIHPSASFGGLVDFVQRGSLESSLEEVAFALGEPGEVSEVVPTQSGFAFVRLEKRVVNEERPPRQVALPQIRGVLENRAKDILRSEITERIQREADVSVQEPLVRRAVLLGEQPAEIVVARACGESITLGQLREFFDLEKLTQAPEEDADEALALYIEKWTGSRATRRAARTLGLLEDPKLVSEADTYRQRLILGRLLDEYIWSEVEFGEQQVRDYYERFLDTEFTRPAEVRLAYATVASEEQAQDIKRRAEAGEDFGQMVRELSLDRDTAVHGGRIGWIRPGRILPEVEALAFPAPIGEFVGPIETELGWFVVHVMEKRASMVVPFEQARRVAAEQLVEELRTEARRRWTERLIERAVIDIDADGIEQAVAWFEAASQSAPELEPESEPESEPAPEPEVEAAPMLGPPAPAPAAVPGIPSLQ